MRTVTIQQVLNGFKVQAGCQELVFQDKAVMIAELSRYIDNPEAVEREYLEKYSGQKSLIDAPGDVDRVDRGLPAELARPRAVERAQTATQRAYDGGPRGESAGRDGGPIGRN